MDAVIVKVSQKDFNLGMHNNRMWSEIGNHKYIFDRQNIDIDILKKISKKEF